MSLATKDKCRHLAIRFAQESAVILCDDGPLRQRLSILLRHCLADSRFIPTRPPLVTLEVEGGNGAYRRLLRDGIQICGALSLADMVERLVYEVTLGIGTKSRARLVFHAAGLAKHGNGIIMGGESGSGKSTLTTRLTAEAYDFLSDELVSISPDGSTMHGFLRHISLKSGAGLVSHGRLYNLFRQTEMASSHGGVYLDPEQLRSGCILEVARPCVLLFPKYSAKATTGLRPLSRAEAAYKLMHLLVNAESFPDRGFSAITRFVCSVVAFCLEYSDAATASANITRDLVI